MHAERSGHPWRLPRIVFAAAALLACPAAASQAYQPAGCLSGALADAAGLRDQFGRKIAAERFGGRLTLVTLVQRDCDFTCVARMIDLDRIARDAAPARGRVALLAIDTGGRSAAGLRQLAAAWRVAPRRWTMLRGRPPAIDGLRRRIDVVPAGAAEPSALVAVFDAGGTLRQRYSGAPLDPERVARELAVIAALPGATSPSACAVAPAPAQPRGALSR